MKWMKRPLLLVLACLAALVGGCAGERACLAMPMNPGAAVAQAQNQARAEFPLQHPCDFDDESRVTGVLLDSLPGEPLRARVTYVVEGRGERAFLFTQTMAEVPFSQIPLGSRRLRLSAHGSDGREVIAEGFTGPSHSDAEIAYFRWRTGGVTYELDAVLHDWQPLREVEAVVRSLIAG